MLAGGSNKNLRYCWQKKGASGWITVSNTGSTKFPLSGSGKKISGQYRCKAVNLENGTAALSKMATVWVKLGCINFRFSGARLTGRVVGGTGPYTIVVVQHRPQDTKTPVRKLNLKVKVSANGTFSIMLDPAEYRYYAYVTEQNGKKVVKQGRAFYSIVVYDADGRKLTSKNLRYPG